MKELIQLRGHHLAVVANYAKGIGRDNPFSQGYTRFDLDGNAVRMGNSSHTWDSLLEDPDQKVELVAGSDIICRQQCPLSTQASCSPQEGDEDDLTLKAYGFQPGEQPTIKTILDRVEMYHAQTGFYSPRNREFRI